jgi:hypothetical protein
MRQSWWRCFHWKAKPLVYSLFVAKLSAEKIGDDDDIDGDDDVENEGNHVVDEFGGLWW